MRSGRGAATGDAEPGAGDGEAGFVYASKAGLALRCCAPNTVGDGALRGMRPRLRARCICNVYFWNGAAGSPNSSSDLTVYGSKART